MLRMTKLMLMFLYNGSNFGVGASGGRSFASGNHPNSLVTKEGLTVIVVKGNICDQTVSEYSWNIGTSPISAYTVGGHDHRKF